MSPMLQHTVVLYTNRVWLDRLWFLRDAEPAFLIKVILSMEQHMYVPGEMPPDENFYAIIHGIVLCRGKILASGMVWGEETLLLNNKADRVPYVARAMTHVQVHPPHRLPSVTMATFVTLVTLVTLVTFVTLVTSR